MKIHGIVYLIVGAVMIAFTAFVENANPDAGISLFTWIGVVFIGIGVFKLIINFVNREKTEKKPKNSQTPRFGFNSELSKVNLDQEALRRKQQIEQQMRQNLAPCPYCKALIPTTSTFCPRCGNKLR